MSVVRCSQGHFYDDQRFSRCPHCGISVSSGGGMASGDGRQKMGGQPGRNSQPVSDGRTEAHERKKGLFGWMDREKTVAFSGDRSGVSARTDMDSGSDHTIALEAVQSMDGDDDQKTIGFYSGAKGNDYVTGWLVCIEGPEKGRDYRLHHGFNRIGRSFQMDVQVMDDPAVTRENHCSVVYDDRKNEFSVIPSSGALTYYNNSLLTKPETLTAGDEIRVGNSKLEFIPFCRKGRVWEKEEES